MTAIDYARIIVRGCMQRDGDARFGAITFQHFLRFACYSEKRGHFN
jgi:hypothetical protein